MSENVPTNAFTFLDKVGMPRYLAGGLGVLVFVGPALVGLFIGIIGSEGMACLLAILYFVSAVLTHFIKQPVHKAKTNDLIID